ncbi:MAG: DMT family transporter [Acidimicrobiales bacterium]|nr:DMT family transporter [Acidimicrobiales bacterium]
MTALLALASALIIGGSDFGGGVATKRDSTFRVTAVAQIAGGVTAVVFVVVVGWDAVTTTDVVAGAIAGASGTFSFICFYRALSEGVMSVVAPTTAVVGAAFPAFVGIARGEELGVVTAVGLVVAIIAIVLVTRERRDADGATTPRSAMVLALVAGVGFSIFFIALAETETAAGMWPLVVARVVSVPVVCVVAWRITRRVLPANRSSLALACYTGVTEMIANALLLIALRRGELAIASVFGSLYPVSTVLLAWVFLRERLARHQVAGVVLALAAIALVAL